MGLFRKTVTAEAVVTALTAPDALTIAISRATEARMGAGIDPGTIRLTRDQAMSLSVVGRARDLICGVLSTLPFTRIRERADRVEDLGPGWLERPDPTRTHGAFIADLVDDLFFYRHAVCRITARFAGTDDTDGFPAALQHVPWSELTLDLGEGEWVWRPTTPTDTRFALPSPYPPGTVIRFRTLDAIHFESPLCGVLETPAALAIARRLDRAAYRFASSTVPMGWLQQKGGDPLDPLEAGGMVQTWSDARDADAIGFLNEWVDYHESSMDPSRLQLVEARAFQDAAVARVCNVPNFSVGVAVPGDSMTYKTAQTARLDLVDFTLAPYIGCIEQTLSGPEVTPRGQRVEVDLEPFLRSRAQLADPAADSPLMEGTK